MAYEDLLKDASESKDDGNYFLVTVTDLDLATQYPIQFRWKNKNGTLGSWSAVKYFTTLGATVPNDPQLQSADVVGGAGFIKVSWSGNDASGNPISNFDRVDVHIHSEMEQSLLVHLKHQEHNLLCVLLEYI